MSDPLSVHLYNSVSALVCLAELGHRGACWDEVIIIMPTKSNRSCLDLEHSLIIETAYQHR